MGKAHATMYTDETNSRLKTRATSFAETSAVIPAQAGMTDGKRGWVGCSCPTYGYLSVKKTAYDSYGSPRQTAAPKDKIIDGYKQP